MTQYRIVHSAIHAAVAGLCWLVLKHLNELEAFITNYKPFMMDYRAFTVPALLFGLALLFRISDRLANAFVEKIPLLSPALRRMLCGGDHIEGDWPLVVVDMEREALLYLGFLTITFKNGQLYVHGDDWTPDGEHAQAFHSVQSLYHEHTLQYWYEQGASLFKPDMRGYTEIYFFPRNAVATRHAGKFLDPKHTSDIRFYAVRQRYGWFQRRLSSSAEKIEAARKLWNQIEPKLSVLKSRDISTDFG